MRWLRRGGAGGGGGGGGQLMLRYRSRCVYLENGSKYD